MEENQKEVVFLLKGKNLSKEIEIETGEPSIRKAIKRLSDNWDLFNLDNNLFGEIESLRIVLRDNR